MTGSNQVRLGRKKRTISKSIVIGPSAIKFITLAVMAVLAIVYLSQSTAGASQAVTVRDIQSSQNNLNLEQERLQAEQTRLTALKNIDSQTQKETMAPVAGVNYVNSTPAAPVHN